MQCPRCGTMLAETDRTCPRCGANAPTQFSGGSAPPVVPALDLPSPQPGAPQPPSSAYAPPQTAYPAPPYPPPNPYPPAGTAPNYNASPPPGYGGGYGAPPPGSYGAPSGAYLPTPAAPPSPRTSSGSGVAIVLGLLGLFVLVFIGLVVFAVVGLNAAAKSESEPSRPGATYHKAEPTSAGSFSGSTGSETSGNEPSSAGGAITEETPSSAGTTTEDGDEKTTTTEGDPVKSETLKLVDDETIERNGVHYVIGHVRNTGEHTLKNVVIRFEILDSDNKKVGTATDDTPTLGPGETWSFEARIDADNADSYRLDSLESE